LDTNIELTTLLTKLSSKEQKGNFFVIEGGEFTGKSSAIILIKHILDDYLISNKIVNDPSTAGLPLATSIREHIIGNDNAGDPITETLGFLLARSELNSKLIKPALKENKIVICDRYTGSTIAYQGFGREEPTTTIELISDSRWALQSEITFLLTASDEIKHERKLQRNHKSDAFDNMKSEFYKRVDEGYQFLKTARGMIYCNTKQVIEIDTSNLTIEKTAEKILKEICCHLLRGEN